jgi:hypothetical protein
MPSVQFEPGAKDSPRRTLPPAPLPTATISADDAGPASPASPAATHPFTQGSSAASMVFEPSGMALHLAPPPVSPIKQRSSRPPMARMPEPGISEAVTPTVSTPTRPVVAHALRDDGSPYPRRPGYAPDLFPPREYVPSCWLVVDVLTGGGHSDGVLMGSPRGQDGPTALGSPTRRLPPSQSLPAEYAPPAQAPRRGLVALAQTMIASHASLPRAPPAADATAGIKLVTHGSSSPTRARDPVRSQATPYARTGRRPASAHPTGGAGAAPARPDLGVLLGTSPAPPRRPQSATVVAATPAPVVAAPLPARAGPLLLPGTPRPQPPPPLTPGLGTLASTRSDRPTLAAMQVGRRRPSGVRPMSPPPRAELCRRSVSAHPIYRRATVLLDAMPYAQSRRLGPRMPMPLSQITNPYHVQLSRSWSPLISGMFTARPIVS